MNQKSFQGEHDMKVPRNMKWLLNSRRTDGTAKTVRPVETRSDMPERTRIPPDFPDTLRRLNYLIDRLGLATYLEVGLGNGGTFDGVNVPHKVGVDPHPWNLAVSHLEGVHTVTSDEYFSRHWNDGVRFDLILLDGLHTAEQTYRDFVNSLHYAHASTIWLIDDVIPSDVFSAIPNQTEAVKQRKAAIGGNDTAWHGDVYKALWMIKTFHNNMRVRTFWRQQPQALIYYSVAQQPPVSGSTLDQIAGLTFDDTLSRRAEYNPGEEDEILRECVSETKKRTAGKK
jgi:hypothetical protein